MISIVNGDILEAEENIIGHQVNCKGVMGAGLARHLRNKDERIYSQYKFYCDTQAELLGSAQFVKVAHNKYVANLFGQEGYGRDRQYTDYNALRSGLNSLKEFAKERVLTVALPYGIGAGLAGGNWEVIYSVINEVFSDYEVVLYKLK